MILSITFDDLCTCLILRGEKNNFVGFLRCSSTIQHSISNNNNFIYTCTYLSRGSTLKSFESLLCAITEVEFLMLDILCVLQKYGPLVFYLSAKYKVSILFLIRTLHVHIYTQLNTDRHSGQLAVYSLNPCVSFVLYLLLIMLLFTPRGLIPEIKSHQQK